MAARRLPGAHFPKLGWWLQELQTVGQARDGRLCLACENARGVKMMLAARADVNGGGGSTETVMTLDLLGKVPKSDAGVRSGDCVATNPKSGSFDARVWVSLVAKAQRATNREKVQDEGFSWISSVEEGHASLHVPSK